MNNKIIKVVLLMTLAAQSTSLWAMSDGAKTGSTRPTNYTKLGKSEPIFAATITDNENSTDVVGINIAGKVTYAKMLQESNDATSTLDLGLIKKIEVKDTFYQSERHYKPGSDQIPFILAEVTFINGDETEEYIFASDVVISAKKAVTGVKMAWLLAKINEITINHDIVIERENKGEKPSEKMDEAADAQEKEVSKNDDFYQLQQNNNSVASLVKTGLENTSIFIQKTQTQLAHLIAKLF